MTSGDLQRVTAFLMGFARRQAAETHQVSGGLAVLDPEYALSHEHNQLLIDGAAVPDEIRVRADELLGHLAHRRVTVFDDAVGAACAPTLVAAGYEHARELVMVSTPAALSTGPLARPVPLPDLLPAVFRQLRTWLPQTDESTVRQLADRRLARLRGAELVRFLAVSGASGTPVSWADLYLEPAMGIAQIEDLMTADGHTRRGHAANVLRTALRQAAGYDVVFLLADADDWPRAWYARRGFTTIGQYHVFTRSAE